MTFILLTFISALFAGFLEFFKKISLKKSSIYEVLFFYTFIGFIISLIFIQDIFNASLIGVTLTFLRALLVGIIWYLRLKAMEKLDVSIAVPFNVLSVVFVSVLATLFLDQIFSYQVIIGVIIVLIGLIFITNIDNKDKPKTKSDYRYISLLILSTFLVAVCSLLDKFILSNNFITQKGLLVLFLFFITIIYGAFYLYHNKKIDFKALTNNKWLILIGVFVVLSEIFIYAATAQVNAHLASINLIKRSSVFLTMFLGALFLKEKNLNQKLIALLITFTGLILIIFI